MRRDTHSRFAPSSSDRWANCQLSLNPPQSDHFAQMIDEEEREDAGLGSACHALGAACLNEHCEPHDFLLDDRQFHRRDVTADMADNAKVYVDFCRTFIADGYEWYVEHHVEAPNIHEDCYGTTDFRGFHAERKHLVMLDYKSGHTYYDPRTYQLAIYASGELNTLEDMGYEVDKITVYIVQPAHTGDQIRKHDYSPKELKRVARDLKKATQGSAAKAGEWCKYCVHSSYCSVLAEYANAVLPGYMHGPEDFDKMVADMTPEMILEIMDRQPVVNIWFAAVFKWAQQLAMLGETFEGYELKGGQGKRKYIDPVNAETVLHAKFGDDIYEPRTLRSPAQIEGIWPEAKSLMAGRPGVPGLTTRPKLAMKLKRKGEKDE